MSVDELSRTFGVDNSSQVDAYEVVPEDPLQRDASAKTKRSDDPYENYAHYSIAANGRYKLKTR